ncbi:Cytochrome P450 76C1 [Senna tora]|uniref:Cytochrome P450 76C1 n=1 Tax=Senna tora TaxID=362788 RepID=A0A834W9C0_9FABA|nr:Cytochrome P450 76C1 [Senna tora]
MGHFDGGAHHNRDRSEPKLHDGPVLVGEGVDGAVREWAYEIEVADDGPWSWAWRPVESPVAEMAAEEEENSEGCKPCGCGREQFPIKSMQQIGQAYLNHFNPKRISRTHPPSCPKWIVPNRRVPPYAPNIDKNLGALGDVIICNLEVISSLPRSCSSTHLSFPITFSSSSLATFMISGFLNNSDIAHSSVTTMCVFAGGEPRPVRYGGVVGFEEGFRHFDGGAHHDWVGPEP